MTVLIKYDTYNVCGIIFNNNDDDNFIDDNDDGNEDNNEDCDNNNGNDGNCDLDFKIKLLINILFQLYSISKQTFYNI